ALSRRRRSLRKKSAAGGGIALIIGAVVIAIGLVVGTGAVVNRVTDDNGRSEGQEDAAPLSEADFTTFLLVGTDVGDTGTEARWMTVIGVDGSGEQASVAYLPAHTAYEVPGRGLQSIGDGLASGGMPLVTVSVENLLGLPLDHYIELSVDDARALFEQTGDLTVNVPQEVRVAAGADGERVLFDAGEQVLSPAFQVDLLYEIGTDGDESTLGARHAAFWQAFTQAQSADPDGLGAAVGAVSGALEESNASNEQQVTFFTDLASTPPEEVTIASLPVDQEIVGETDLYSTDEAEVRSFVEATFGELPDLADEVRVQILNGNGQPGIGEEVAGKLVGEGFRIVLSGNADRLDYEETRIVVYESTPEAEAQAERARDLLGVGEVQVSVQQQGIVDLTIVVGKDFIDATEADND
ncbi:MAG: LCP family protein, partial [Actinomycetota bacterium]|nr:LCP family protein [Actinomycetota bacterium]